MKNFYEKLLPTQGTYCVVSIKDKVVKHSFASTHNELNNLLKYAPTDHNIYVAPNTFMGYSRTADSAVYGRSFFVDLDVGGTEGKYHSQEAAKDALHEFNNRHLLGTRPAVVNSGTGLQAYWVMDRDLPIAEWSAVAKRFKQFCQEAGLKIDASVTADAARVLRCPDTLNFKTDPPSPTSVIEDITQVDFDVFKALLGDVIQEPQDIFAGIERGLDDDTAAITSNYKTKFEDLAVLSLSDKGCAQIKNIIVNAKDISNPLWTAGLSIAWHCVDRDEAIHKISEDHPDYSYEATIKAASRWEGPRTCEWFAGEAPAGCAECPFKGKITSPIQIARHFDSAPFAEDLPPQAEQAAVPSGPAPFPKYLYPFVRGAEGGIFFVPSGKGDEDAELPIKILQHDLCPIKRIVGGANGECLVIRHTKPHDPVEEFILPLKIVCSNADLSKILGEHGEIMTGAKQASLVVLYLKKWTEYFQQKEAAEMMRMQMGWTTDHESFVIGTREITSAGTDRQIAPSPMVRNISKLLKTRGSYEVWQENINKFLNGAGMELHSLGVFAAFGSPLMAFTGTAGATIAFISTNSGVGKTALMYAGLSVFADPVEISVYERGATENGLRGRFLGLKNILLGIDEASNIDKQELSNLIHNIAQGKSKIRMHSSENRERDLEMMASLLAIVTSNLDLEDVMYSLKASPDGELARLLQFGLSMPKVMLQDPMWSREVVEPLKTNYGWAGPVYIKHLYTLSEDVIRQRLIGWDARLCKDFAPDAAYRFHRNALSACFLGAELAVEAGIIQVDVERVYEATIVEMLLKRKQTRRLNDTDYRGLITEFYHKNIDKFLIVSKGRVISEPRGELIGRIEEDVGIMIAKSKFKEFLTAKVISEREFVAVLTKTGILRGAKKARLATGWKAGTGAMSPVYVYDIEPILLAELSETEAEKTENAA